MLSGARKAALSSHKQLIYLWPGLRFLLWLRCFFLPPPPPPLLALLPPASALVVEGGALPVFSCGRRHSMI